MSVNGVSTSGPTQTDESAAAYAAGVIATAEQQALNWQEYNFEEPADSGHANGAGTDGVETESSPASQRALDAFYANDPNRPASTLPSSSSSPPPERMNITDAEANEMIAAGYNVESDGNGGWVLNLNSDWHDVTVQAPPSQESVALPGVSGETTSSAATPTTNASEPTTETNGDAGSQVPSGASADDVDAVTGAGKPTSNKIDTVLDQKVEDMLNQSPTLRRLWDQAVAKGWKLVVTEDVDKSQANPNTDPPTVFINPKDIGPGGDQIAKMASLVSHEMGHAATPFSPPIQSDDRSEFIAKNTEQSLRHEGAAAFINAKTRDEIIANGGPDIGIRGGLDEWYIYVYDDFKAGRITEPQAIESHGGVDGLRTG